MHRHATQIFIKSLHLSPYLCTNQIQHLKLYHTRSYRPLSQYVISICMVLAVSLIAFAFSDLIGYKVVALILLMTVSVVAMLFEIFPVLLTALLSALIWNFFFIPPIFGFHIERTEDMLMFLLYFVVALVNTVMSFKIRKEEKKAREKEQEAKQIAFYNTLLNSLSHELRTPISTIIGAVDVLREPGNKLTKEQSEELLLQIDTAGMRLNRQVENLLNMSRLESGILSPAQDWCDTNELILSVLADFKMIETHEFVFTPNDDLPLVKIDRGLMEQVIHNLVHNSVIYTPEDSTIVIQSSIANESWRICVSDNGPGIPEKNLRLIFDKFYRVPSSKTGGSGLGLSIVKGFIEMNGGTIIAKKNGESGLLIRIELKTEISFMNRLKNE
ncbi:MAG: sensor histidine kinase [Candidatus Fluviicola riflensis]|nr:MAG: sensor histidine kinase [Candidatus Fluviicola riflensis]